MAKPVKRCILLDCKWHDSLLAFGGNERFGPKTYYLPEHCATCINLYRDLDNYEREEDNETC